MTTEPNKLICKECGCRTSRNQMLTAVNPFDPGYVITGCPKCKDINTLSRVCDEPGCWESVCCGFPTPIGYRQTCDAHSDFARQ